MLATAYLVKNPWLKSSQALGVKSTSAILLNGHCIKVPSKFTDLYL